MTAAARWAEALSEWAIPDEILAAAPESPWGFPVSTSSEATRDSLAEPWTATHARASEALPQGGVLMDVGAGAGAASLPVADRASRLVAVDENARMLEALAGLAAGAAGVTAAVDLVQGRWPDAAAEAGSADVVVCAHVAYNVGDLGPFVEALTRAATERVVMELTAVHPQTPMSPLWLRFWGLERPVRPTAEDAAAVVADAIGVEPGFERWRRDEPFLVGHGDADVAWARRRLCLQPEADPEVEVALHELGQRKPSELVTMWWPGQA